MSRAGRRLQSRPCLHLTRAEVVRCCASLDVVEIVADTLRQHALGATLLPDEAYLGWCTPHGDAARCLAMPGGLLGDGRPVLGMKVMGSSLGNPRRGLARAHGLTILLDHETAEPRAVMEAAHISALRTAAVTAVTARRLGVTGLGKVAVIGCGALASAHLEMLPAALPGLRRILLYDSDPWRSRDLAVSLAGDHGAARMSVAVADSAEACVRGAELVVTVTTAAEGYIAADWLRPGALIAHVSLEDVLAEVVQSAGLLLVDDWDLVRHDQRRLLGRLHRQGRLRGPDGGYHADSTPDPHARRVDATLGDVLVGRHPGRRDDREIILSNPFGMAVLDVAVAHEVVEVAAAHGLGRTLPA